MANDLGKTAWWLDGNFAPVTDEVEAFDLSIEGALPPELSGVYMRNGPNPKHGASPHWFSGDGMLHGIRLEAGKAHWYRNRFVQTPKLGAAPRPPGTAPDPEQMMDRTRSSANTNVMRHAGKIFALEEAHFPFEVTPELATKGYSDFAGKLTGPFTAHPKVCPVTGEMFAFGYSFAEPFLAYYRIDAAGELQQVETIPVGGPTMIHDFCVTASRVVFMDLPVIFDLELAMQGSMPYRWSDEYPARLGVMPRAGRADQLQWFDIPSCYVFHPLNAYDDGQRVVLDLARYDYLWDKTRKPARARLTRFEIDPAAASVTQRLLSDLPIEFPRVADAKTGLPHRYGYAPAMQDHGQEIALASSELLKYDLKRGSVERFDFGAGLPGEFVIASAQGGEDAGWLMGYTYDRETRQSSFAVFDATRLTKGPIARVGLPQRVPFGFHGNWFAD
jgi:carotenoid cleavage dioxygenase